MDPNKISLFSDAIRFTPLCIYIDLILIFHFWMSWYRSWKKTGWKLDFWNFTLFFQIFIPVLLMYPFNASIFNFTSTGEHILVLDNQIDKAFCITIIGYVCMWLGRYIYDCFKWEFRLYYAIELLSPFFRLVEKNLRDQKTLFFLFLCVMLTSIATFYTQSQDGQLFNPRKFFLANDALRPIFNLTITLIQIALIFSGIRYLQYKSKIDRYLFIIFFLLSLFLGVRGIAVLCILSFVVFRIFAKNGQFNTIKLLIQCLGLVLLGLLIEYLRNKDYYPQHSMTNPLMQIFYGNHFSDTRDFAWILGYWDEKYVYGKTYLAGFLSFIPRFLSDFRQEWAMGVYTNSLVNFDMKEHAGLRPGLFGEVFLNFGYIGVICLGFIAGYAIRYADCMLRRAVNNEGNIIKGYSKTLIFFFVSNFFVTAGFWGLYIFILLNLLLYFMNRIRFSSAYT